MVMNLYSHGERFVHQAAPFPAPALVFNFQGIQELVELVLVNPYTGVEVAVNDVKNVNSTMYVGGPSGDTIFGTSLSDMLTLEDEFGNPTVISIENFIGSSGDDIFNLSSLAISYGSDVFMSLGSGDDIGWGEPCGG